MMKYRNFRGLPTYAYIHAKVSKLIFYVKILELTGHIGIIFHHFEFSTNSANQFLKTSIHVEFRKNPGIEPINKTILNEDFEFRIRYAETCNAIQCTFTVLFLFSQ